MQSNIGYCLSGCLLDNGINLDPRICFILSDALWLGLNTRNDKYYSPLQNNYVSFINPQAVENFSVNSNCLLASFRCNEKDHLQYVIKRLQNQKKALVKISDNILYNSGLNKVSKPLFALVTNVSENIDGRKHGLKIKLAFTNDIVLEINDKDFLKYWTSDSDETFNSEWHVLTTPVMDTSPVYLKKQLRIALLKQLYFLMPQSSELITGSAVLTYLINSVKRKVKGPYRAFDNNILLWRNSFMTFGSMNGSKREYYAVCLDYMKDMTEMNLEPLINTLNNAGKIWNDLHNYICNDETQSESGLLEYYKELLIMEEAICGRFKETVQRLNL